MVDANSTPLMIAAFSALAAAGAFVFSIVKQSQDQRKLSETRAKTAWDNYLKMAFDNPDLTSTPSGNDVSSLRYEQYEYFVYRLLYASEEILNYAPNDVYWVEAIRSQVEYHVDYIKGEGEDYINFYRPKLADIIRKAALMPKLTVDGITLEVPQGATVLQACESVGKD